tara:strand:+ start:203 stop:358 length:156 start_codon:yes stop_codon:yes gene_type:complete
MVRVRLYYTSSEGGLASAEMLMDYEDKTLSETLEHYRKVGMLVTTEYFENI